MALSTGSFKVMTLTDAAAARISEIMAKAEKPALGLRIGLTKGGCAGMEYTFALAEERQPGDEVITDKGATVVVDGKAVLFLFGAELDFKVDKLASTFVVHNPNQVSACGCGESVSLSLSPIAPEALGGGR